MGPSKEIGVTTAREAPATTVAAAPTSSPRANPDILLTSRNEDRTLGKRRASAPIPAAVTDCGSGLLARRLRRDVLAHADAGGAQHPLAHLPAHARLLQDHAVLGRILRGHQVDRLVEQRVEGLAHGLDAFEAELAELLEEVV